MKTTSILSVIVSLFIIISGCSSDEKTTFNIDYEKYELDNGLDVILHHDDSDPIVAVAVQYHVGSSREVTGKTGFAHLFEHMLFQESENIPQDQYFKTIQNVGGTLNGFTSRDLTTYFEVVPKNALEKVLWAESDRMGFFINTVTHSAFANQQNVVMNEKRQGYDNRPYGHTRYVLHSNLYPEGHPYSWQVIGEMEDLKNATVEDVRNFYDKFYGPNNATLVVAGDFKKDSVKNLIDKYFAEIQKRQEVAEVTPKTVSLSETKKLYHEDNFAKVPEITMVWPTAPEYHKDAYALDFLANLLSRGKKSPMYKVMIKDKELTSRTSAYNSTGELAGEFTIRLKANDDYSLAEMEEAVFESMKMFEDSGINERDLERVKATLETDFYNGLNSILYKSFNLAFYNSYTGNPGFIEKDIENIQAVTVEDVMRVYEEYIKDRPYVATSFVPKGEVDKVAEKSVKADIVEENIAEASEVEQLEKEEAEIKKTPSVIDRSKAPELGPEPTVNLPEVYTAELNNGLKVYGIESDELPLVEFRLNIDGGYYLDDLDKIGVAKLITDIMKEGTKNKTPEELEEEIQLLGARIYMFTRNEELFLGGSTLSRNFKKTMDLVEEMLLEPRWDQEQFKILKTKTINDIKRNSASPNYIANEQFNRLVYSADHAFGHDAFGTAESIKSITMDDMKAFYEKYFSPSISRFHVAGAVTKEQVLEALDGLEDRWQPKEVHFPKYEMPVQPEKAQLYFYDQPGAKQSVIKIGYAAVPRTHEDYFPAWVMNYKLGGSFSGVLNLILREEKGFTYGAWAAFNGGIYEASFSAGSSVRSNATLESVVIFRDEMQKYREGISEEDLEFTKNALLRSNARKFESLSSLVWMLQNMSKYNLPPDYIREEEEIIRNMDAARHRELAKKYIDPTRMIYVVVGDAETQLEPLKKLGFGDPILLN